MRNVVTFPPPVCRGDRVGIAALSGPVDAKALESGVDGVRELGFEPVLASNLLSKERLFAGSDEARLGGFEELLRDHSIKAIIFARGGHGLLRLLPHLDWDVLSRIPRAYVGYSDVTPLLNILVERTGYVAFHGPMVAVDVARGLERRERESLLSALAGETPAPLQIAGWGEAGEGRLVGGCLSMVSAVAGTPYELRGEERVLFWEDVDEPIYRVDRMLTQLRLSGSLTAIRGMVMGQLELREDETNGDLLVDLLQEYGRELSCPVAYGLPCGHGAPNLTLPLGLDVRIDPGEGTLTFLKPAEST